MTIQEVRFDLHIRKGDKDLGGKFDRNTRSQQRSKKEGTINIRKWWKYCRKGQIPSIEENDENLRANARYH